MAKASLTRRDRERERETQIEIETLQNAYLVAYMMNSKPTLRNSPQDAMYFGNLSGRLKAHQSEGTLGCIGCVRWKTVRSLLESVWLQCS